jgi:hypothetical protein
MVADNELSFFLNRSSYINWQIPRTVLFHKKQMPDIVQVSQVTKNYLFTKKCYPYIYFSFVHYPFGNIFLCVKGFSKIWKTNTETEAGALKLVKFSDIKPNLEFVLSRQRHKYASPKVFLMINTFDNTIQLIWYSQLHYSNNVIL